MMMMTVMVIFSVSHNTLACTLLYTCFADDEAVIIIVVVLVIIVLISVLVGCYFCMKKDPVKLSA